MFHQYVAVRRVVHFDHVARIAVVYDVVDVDYPDFAVASYDRVDRALNAALALSK